MPEGPFYGEWRGHISSLESTYTIAYYTRGNFQPSRIRSLGLVLLYN